VNKIPLLIFFFLNWVLIKFFEGIYNEFEKLVYDHIKK